MSMVRSFQSHGSAYTGEPPHLAVCVGATQHRVPYDAKGRGELTAMLLGSRPGVSAAVRGT